MHSAAERDGPVAGIVRTHITRRELLRHLAAAIGGAALHTHMIGCGEDDSDAATPQSAPPNPLSGDALYRDVVAYSSLGDHRTATDVDARTSDWIRAELLNAGFAARALPFAVRQFFPRSVRLEVARKPVGAFPYWPPHPTGPAGIHAGVAAFRPGTSVSVRDHIAIVEFPFNPGASSLDGGEYADLITRAADAGALAVVAVTAGPTNDLIAVNSPAQREPWPVPVLLIAPRDEAVLAAAVSDRTPVSLVLDGDYELAAQASNTIGELQRGPRSIVISTPQSGWFRCAGERGPGVALFLGLARWASRRRSPVSYVFLCTSGHELGFAGLRDFLSETAPAPEQVLCWLHLGAGIATWAWVRTDGGLRRLDRADSRRLLLSSSDLEQTLSTAFAPIPSLKPTRTSGAAPGELGLVAERYRTFFGIVGAHMFHHTPGDGPETTAPELLEPVGHALVTALQAIEARATA